MTKNTDGGNVYKQVKSFKRRKSTMDCSAIYEEEEKEDSFPKTFDL